jgi:hypothetical protein
MEPLPLGSVKFMHESVPTSCNIATLGARRMSCAGSKGDRWFHIELCRSDRPCSTLPSQLGVISANPSSSPIPPSISERFLSPSLMSKRNRAKIKPKCMTRPCRLQRSYQSPAPVFMRNSQRSIGCLISLHPPYCCHLHSLIVLYAL